MSRVLYVTFGERAVDGLVVSQVQAMIRRRAEMGDHVTWVAFIPAHRFLEGLDIGVGEPFEYVPFPVPVRNLWVAPWYLRALAGGEIARRLLIHRGPWDVVHCRSYPAALWAMTNLREADASKFVFDPRGVYPEESAISGPSAKNPTFAARWSAVEIELLNRADTVICVSERMREHFEQVRPGVSVKAVVVPCSGGNRQYDSARHSTREIDGLRACFLGSIGTWTGLDDIVNSVIRLDRIQPVRRLTVFGHCDVRALRAKLSGSMLGRVVVSSKAMPQREVFSALAGQDVGLLPRSPGLVNEVSWPAKLSEYLLAGLPVVTNLRDSNIGDVLARHKALILEGANAVHGLESVSVGDARARTRRAQLAYGTMSLEAVSSRMGDAWKA